MLSMLVGQIDLDKKTFPNVSLLMLPNGMNRSPDIKDYSTNTKLLTVAGNVVNKTDRNPFGLAEGSIYFDGTGDYISTPNADDINDFGTGDFCIDGWAYVENTAVNQVFISSVTTWTTLLSFWVGIYAGRLNCLVGDGGIHDYITAGSFTQNSWTHFEVSRTNGVLYIGLAGTVESHACTINVAGNSATYMGSLIGTPSFMFTGNLAYIRIKKGVGGNVTNFTPPTTPPYYPDKTFPTYRASETSGANTSGSGSVNVKTVVNVVGDLLVLAFTGRDLSNVTTSTGWTRILRSQVGTGQYLYIYTKTASSSEPSTSEWVLASKQYSAVMLSLKNAQIDQVGTITSDADMTSYTASSITSTEIGLLLTIAQIDDSASCTPPESMIKVAAYNSAAASNTLTIAIQSISTGATGIRTGTTTSTSKGSSIQISVKSV